MLIKDTESYEIARRGDGFHSLLLHSIKIPPKNYPIFEIFAQYTQDYFSQGWCFCTWSDKYYFCKIILQFLRTFLRFYGCFSTFFYCVRCTCCAKNAHIWLQKPFQIWWVRHIFCRPKCSFSSHSIPPILVPMISPI